MSRRGAGLRLLVVAVVTLVMLGRDHARAEGWQDLVGPSQVHLRAVVESRSAATESVETIMQRAIAAGDRTFTVGELTTIVRISVACCHQSAALSGSLTGWLRENHPIYAGRLPTEASQFRGFLLSSLGAFPTNDELYGYVRAEFLFGGHAFGIAAAAVAARSFSDRADDLVPLMEPFLASSFDDDRVDITTPELNYPIAHPTKARYEIIRTLLVFGPHATRSVSLLDAIVACPSCGSYGGDSMLVDEAARAAAAIRKATLPCCRNEAVAAAAGTRGLQVIDRRYRKPLAMGSVKLLDQDGRSLAFSDLQGRPFVLTFFYSQCTNALKCVSTVRRLRDLARECAKDGLADKVGIYGMTYDPQFDTPSVLNKYGKLHGMAFSENVRLVKTVEDELGAALRDQLALRVSYGAGSVNQHGIQLFVFDNKGRLAGTQDNELWSTTDIKHFLARLAGE
jgi:protein SCO1/2